MQYTHKYRFSDLTLYYVLFLSLTNGHVECIANIPGSATLTRVTHFLFLQNLGNPCGIVRELPPETSTSSSTNSSGNDTENFVGQSGYRQIEIRREFYQSMVTAVALALQKIAQLENADPTLPECNGLYLESLPPTPPIETMRESKLFKQVYQTGIYLAAHLHIMGLDRQLTADGNNEIPDDQVEEREPVPSWRIFRCGNESESILTSITDATQRIEDMLCTLVSSANLSQRASFRTPYNRLIQTKIFRYHSSCSLIQTRDCLVVRESKQSLTYIHKKFTNLLESITESTTNLNNAFEDMDNSL